MRLLRSVKLLIALAVLAVGSISVRAQSSIAAALQSFDQDVRNFNLVAIGTGASHASSFASYGDTQGGLAVQGNLTLNSNGASLVNNAVSGNTDPTLIVGGTLTLDGETKLNNGYASIFQSKTVNSGLTWDGTTGGDVHITQSSTGDLNTTNAGATNDPLTTSTPAGFSWSTEDSSLTSISSYLGSMGGSALSSHGTNSGGFEAYAGTISVSGGNLVFSTASGVTPVAGSTVVFTLDVNNATAGTSTLGTGANGNEYAGQTFSNISISVPNDVNYVIDVVNTTAGSSTWGASGGTGTLFTSGVNFNSGSNDSNLLWNIEGTGTLALGTGNSFYGSILAPSVDLTNNGNTTVNGQIAADSFTDTNTELHYLGFTPVSVVIPEPVTCAIWGLGLCGLAIFARRKLIS